MRNKTKAKKWYGVVEDTLTNAFKLTRNYRTQAEANRAAVNLGKRNYGEMFTKDVVHFNEYTRSETRKNLELIK